MIPDSLRSEVEAALAARIDNASTLGGGCISNATRLTLANGDYVFLKWGSDSALFSVEAYALEQLADTNTVRVPRTLSTGDGWILLEWLEPGAVTTQGWQQLGVALAGLHSAQGKRFGWVHDNFIGSLPQSNTWSAQWPAFWRDQRILPQLERASRSGALNEKDRRRIETMAACVDEIAGPGDRDGASLLHGDLWGGNVHGLASGHAAVIDPSSYYGHREVDLAMARLFGGFDRAFFDGYAGAWALLPGHEQRRHLYQLYYLLVHVNLFGASYRAGTMAAVGKLGF
jgi:protein-ribulosamine 3-kinase